MADIFQIPITVPVLLDEAGSMGAAVTGGVGVGLFDNFDAVEKFIRIHSVHHPVPENSAVYQHTKELFDECYFSLQSVFKKM